MRHRPTTRSRSRGRPDEKVAVAVEEWEEEEEEKVLVVVVMATEEKGRIGNRSSEEAGGGGSRNGTRVGGSIEKETRGDVTRQVREQEAAAGSARACEGQRGGGSKQWSASQSREEPRQVSSTEQTKEHVPLLCLSSVLGEYTN